MADPRAGDRRAPIDCEAVSSVSGSPGQLTDASLWAPLLVADIRPADHALIVSSSRAPSSELPLGQFDAELQSCTIAELSGMVEASIDFAWLDNVAERAWQQVQPGGDNAWAQVARVLRPAGRWIARGQSTLGGMARHRCLRQARSAGLIVDRSFAAYPQAGRPNYVLPVDTWSLPPSDWQRLAERLLMPLNRAGWQARAKRWLATRTVRHAWMRGSSAAWFLSGRRAGVTESRDGDMGCLAQHLLSGCGLRDYHPALVLPRRTQTVVVPALRSRDGAVVYLKWATGPAGRRALARHGDFLARLVDHGPASLAVPRLLARQDFLSSVCLVESSLDGLPGGRFPGRLEPLTERAASYLLAFQRATCVETPCSEAAVSRWRERFRQVAQGEFWRRLRQPARAIEPFLRQVGKVKKAVLSHGDFHLGNVLFDPVGASVTGVLDWDLADEAGLPAADLVQLLLSVALRRRNTTRAAAVGALLAGRDVTGRGHVERYCQVLAPELSPCEAIRLYLGVHLWRVAHQAEYLADDLPAWQRLLDETQSLIELPV